MTCHLVSDSNYTSPERRTGACTSYLSPASIDIVSHAGSRISVGCNIWQATLAGELRLYRLWQTALKIWLGEELAYATSTSAPGTFIIGICCSCTEQGCASNSSDPRHICREVNG